MRNIVTLLLFMLPATRAKNFLLRRLGHPIHRTAHIGPTFLLRVGRFEAGPNSRVVFGNVFRGITTVILAEDAVIGQFNWMSAGSTFVAKWPLQATLTVGEGAAIVSRHYIDCSGGVELERFSLVAGVRSTLLTHQINHTTGRQEIAPIRICADALLNSNNRVVAGAVLPPRSMTGIGAVVLPGLKAPGRLYAGVPARDIKSIEDSALFDRVEATIEP